MVSLTQLCKTIAAEIEWSFILYFSRKSTDQDLYEIWAKKRRNLFQKWGNLPTIGIENRRLESLKNKYEGERIFIVGNAPSLNNTPLEKLEEEYTFCVNRIYLLFDKINWRPLFYTINDWEVGPDNAKEIEALEDMTLFFPKRFQGLFKQTDSTYWYNSRHARFKGDDFSYDLTDGAVMGGSVLPLVIQIAYYMGFDPIYLIGVDVDYKILDTVEQSGTKQFADGNLQFLKSTQDDDPNHFDSRYFGKDRRWHNPNVERMIEGFRVCREAVEQKGGHIYNATVGGKLEVMERVEFNSIFEQDFNPPPKVSIVMPAYNAEPFIDEAINSVLAQTYKDWELIIVNDGSQDNTKQVIESFRDPRIICIDQENAGRSETRNTALQRVRGEYITFLDADDFYLPDKLELQVKFLREHENAGAVVGGVKRISEEGQVIKFKAPPNGKVISTKSFLTGNPALLQSTMSRRQWVNPSVLFNPEAQAGEDWEFNIRLALAGCTFVQQNAIVCSYRSTQQAKRKTTEQYAEAMVAVVDRIFAAMDPASTYQDMEATARYHVNLRMAARFFSTEQYEQGQKYFIEAIRHRDKFNDSFYEDVSNYLVGWITQFDGDQSFKVLKAAISYLPDTIDKKRTEELSLFKLDKNPIFGFWRWSLFTLTRKMPLFGGLALLSITGLSVGAVVNTQERWYLVGGGAGVLLLLLCGLSLVYVRFLFSRYVSVWRDQQELSPIKRAALLLLRLVGYYTRWPVVFAISAIALNTTAMFDVPYRWAFMIGGTSMLLFLVGHSASKADVALEAAEKAHSRANSALKTGKKAFEVADLALGANGSTLETANQNSRTMNSSTILLNRTIQQSNEWCEGDGSILKTKESERGSEFP